MSQHLGIGSFPIHCVKIHIHPVQSHIPKSQRIRPHRTIHKTGFHDCQPSFGVKHDIKTVLEMPAHGAKAMPSIYSLGFGTCAQKITLVNGNPKYISEWKKIGAAHKIEWVHEDDILQSSFQDKSYDFVWNFAYLPTCPDSFRPTENRSYITPNTSFSTSASCYKYPFSFAHSTDSLIPVSRFIWGAYPNTLRALLISQE